MNACSIARRCAVPRTTEIMGGMPTPGFTQVFADVVTS